MRRSVESFFHCCLLLLVYMIHILDGGPTLDMDPLDLQVEECSDLVDAPPNQHYYHDIMQLRVGNVIIMYEYAIKKDHNKFAKEMHKLIYHG